MLDAGALRRHRAARHDARRRRWHARRSCGRARACRRPRMESRRTATGIFLVEARTRDVSSTTIRARLAARQADRRSRARGGRAAHRRASSVRSGRRLAWQRPRQRLAAEGEPRRRGSVKAAPQAEAAEGGRRPRCARRCDKKAEDVVVLDLRKAGGFTDYFVICTGDEPAADQRDRRRGRGDARRATSANGRRWPKAWRSRNGSCSTTSTSSSTSSAASAARSTASSGCGATPSVTNSRTRRSALRHVTDALARPPAPTASVRARPRYAAGGPVCPACWARPSFQPPLCAPAATPASRRVISLATRCAHVPPFSSHRVRRAASVRRHAAAAQSAALTEPRGRRYDGALREIIHAFKYDGRRSLAAPLAAMMRRDGAAVLLATRDAVVPVPLHPVAAAAARLQPGGRSRAPARSAGASTRSGGRARRRRRPA